MVVEILHRKWEEINRRLSPRLRQSRGKYTASCAEEGPQCPSIILITSVLMVYLIPAGFAS